MKAKVIGDPVASLSIRKLVALWAGSLLVVWAGLVFGWFVAKARLAGIDQRVMTDVRALDAAQELELAVLHERREDLLWQATGEDQYSQDRDSYMAVADRIAAELDPYITTQNERESSEQILRGVNALRDESQSGVVSSSEMEGELTKLLSAVRQFKAENNEQMQESIRVAEELGKEISDWAVALSIGTASLLLVGSSSIVSRVVRPALVMTNAARAFGQGDFSARATIRHDDEMGALARTFNNMADDIADREQDRLQFVAMVVHDLKNPAYAIETAARMLPQCWSNEQDRQLCLDTIEQESKRVRTIIRDLTDDIQVTSGRFSMHKARVDLCALVGRLMQTQAQAFAGHKIVVENGENCTVLGDADRLERVVQNLVSNAVKYSPRDSQVTVRIGRKDSYAVLAVSDQGPGISQDDLKILFQPFGRGRSAGRLAEGAGLGLYVVKQIIEAHGGRIDPPHARGSISDWVRRRSGSAECVSPSQPRMSTLARMRAVRLPFMSRGPLANGLEPSLYRTQDSRLVV
jgi:signal transduction histidine kinase